MATNAIHATKVHMLQAAQRGKQSPPAAWTGGMSAVLKPPGSGGWVGLDRRTGAAPIRAPIRGGAQHTESWCRELDRAKSANIKLFF